MEHKKPTIETCLETIKGICEGKNFTEEQLKHRARILFLLNRLDFFDDMPILFEEINYQRELAKNKIESELPK